MEKRKFVERHAELIKRPEDIVYRAFYAPVKLSDLLASAETRSKIRRLPVPHLCFAAKDLSDEEMVALLPHITEEQWAGMLDFEIWRKDRMDIGSALNLIRHVVDQEVAVGRKLLRATDRATWELILRKGLQVYARTEEDEFDGEPDEGREAFVTPDGNFLLALPRNAERARIYRAIILRLYELDSAAVAGFLTELRLRTTQDLEEDAYQDRRRRLEDLGFQDYYDAVSIYTPLFRGDPLPSKTWKPLSELSTLPRHLSPLSEGPLLLFQTIASVESTEEVQLLVEEVFGVCNKLLNADSVHPADSARIRRTIRKALSGINLGLDYWTGGSPALAIDAVRKYYLMSLFQVGYGELLRLRKAASEAVLQPAPGSFLEAALTSMRRRYPVLAEQRKERIGKRYFESRDDVEWGLKLLSQLSPSR